MSHGSERARAAAANVGLPDGRMISASKSGYRRRYPDQETVFNGTLADAEGAGLWWGDLDLTVDEPKLVALAAELGTTIHVIYESDAMFISRDEPHRSELSSALVRITPGGETIAGPHRWRPKLSRNDAGQLVLVREE
jgi:hypothetical protein